MRAWLVAVIITLAVIAGAVAGGLVAGVQNNRGTTTQVQPTPAPTAVVVATLPNIPQVIDTVRQSVVSIKVVSPVQLGPRSVLEESEGTGFVISADGLIATNAHVVSGAQSITITLPDASTATATLVGIDNRADLAVVRVAKSGLVPLLIGSSADLRVGETVIAIGNALALEGGPTASLGIVSAKNRSITAQDGSVLSNLIQTDAAINEGDSGGPLVNVRGEVIAINTISASAAQNIGFAIAIDEAMDVIERLIQAAGS